MNVGMYMETPEFENINKLNKSTKMTYDCSLMKAKIASCSTAPSYTAELSSNLLLRCLARYTTTLFLYNKKQTKNK